ncbi:MAG: PAS domain-containing protein, partial [Alphaproteobacteria bacterium]|nr:PAS domain-containing protein [Alphaproteobacteria bacterium]
MRLVRLGHSVRAALARRASRAALAQLECRFRDALEAMLEGVAVFDADDRLVAWNGEYERFFRAAGVSMADGVTHDELMRDCVAAGMFPAACEREAEWLVERRALHRFAGDAQELHIGDRWFSVREYPTADGGSVGLRYDITALKQTEAALREAETRAGDFASASGDWVWETEAEHRLSGIEYGSRSDFADPAVYEPSSRIG